MSRKLAVIAIGGNSLIKHRDKQSVEDQYLALCETMEHIADVIQQGWQVLITHGNGPQVGFIMLRSEIARAVAGMHIVPLVSCVADTQGAIGYQIQQSLDNVLKRRGLADKTGRTVSLVTQVRVDIADPVSAIQTSSWANSTPRISSRSCTNSIPTGYSSRTPTAAGGAWSLRPSLAKSLNWTP